TGNTPPAPDPIPGQSTTEGGPLVVSATFTDPDAGDIHTAVFDWGDGTSGPGVVTATGPGTYDVSASHDYADDGSYQGTLTITDAAGESASTDLVTTVANAPPAVTAGLSFSQPAGTPRVEVVVAGEFVDPGFSLAAAGTVETFSADLDWGDGAL